MVGKLVSHVGVNSRSSLVQGWEGPATPQYAGSLELGNPFLPGQFQCGMERGTECQAQNFKLLNFLQVFYSSRQPRSGGFQLPGPKVHYLRLLSSTEHHARLH